ncbi:MAG: type IX secretion system membrane protein PorP/SprF [Flavobacteriaceae bacterium]|nr:type IX secretion system membrane protein PorP/SprF [Flavobacteriaceae bacterium]
MKPLKSSFYLVILLLLTAFPIETIGQQLPQFTQYMYNTIAINPAYAGSRETLTVIGLHRSQWAGFEGGPTTQTLSVHSPLRDNKIGLGFSFINDELGFENFTYMYGDFSYTIRLNDISTLSFGLKAGFTAFSVDNELYTSNPTDQIIGNIENRWTPNLGAGIMWMWERGYLGLSAPRLVKNSFTPDSDFIALERVSYYFTGGYVFDIGLTTRFKPSFMIKATNGATISTDISANFLFLDKLWLGAAYRFNNTAGAIGLLADFQIFRDWRVGYAFELPRSEIRSYSNGTHEVILMYQVFSPKRRETSPRYY